MVTVEMLGPAPSIPDIVLSELPPEPVQLLCQEQLQEEEVEHRARELYKILLTCGYCGRCLVLFVRGTAPSVRLLHHLLLDDLDIVCGCCGRAYKHGG